MALEEIEKVLFEPTKQMKKIYDELDKYVFEIGIITDKSQRTMSFGVTNAELMYIHELGSPARNIPARPILQLTIEYAQKELLPPLLDKIVDGIADGWSENDIKAELDKTAIRMQNYARKHIRDNDLGLAPNKPATIKRKGSDIPLLDSGQLSRSITCRVIKK